MKAFYAVSGYLLTNGLLWSSPTEDCWESIGLITVTVVGWWLGRERGPCWGWPACLQGGHIRDTDCDSTPPCIAMEKIIFLLQTTISMITTEFFKKSLKSLPFIPPYDEKAFYVSYVQHLPLVQDAWYSWGRQGWWFLLNRAASQDSGVYGKPTAQYELLEQRPYCN